MTADTPLRIATRNSPLAMWQAEFVAARLAEHDVPTQIVPLVSTGDVDMRPIDGTRQVGVFTKRIQIALLDDEADIAVHSLKDLPTEFDDQFHLAAIPTREIVNDSLVSADAHTLESLPQSARVGTGSRRRRAQLLAKRPDLKIAQIRGNVQTRLSKIEAGEFDAIILAEAGLVRLEMHDLSRAKLSLHDMLPAPGQGALAIEVLSQKLREDDTARIATGLLDDLDTRLAVTAERTLLALLNGGCLAPIAAHATVDGETVTMKTRVLSIDGKRILAETASADLPQSKTPESREEAIGVAVKLAEQTAAILADQGAKEIIHEAADR